MQSKIKLTHLLVGGNLIDSSSLIRLEIYLKSIQSIIYPVIVETLKIERKIYVLTFIFEI